MQTFCVHPNSVVEAMKSSETSVPSVSYHLLLDHKTSRARGARPSAAAAAPHRTTASSVFLGAARAGGRRAFRLAATRAKAHAAAHALSGGGARARGG